MKYSKVIEQHEKRLIERAGDNNPFMGEVRRMLRGVTSLESLALNRNPKHTEEAHIADIAKASRRLKTEADAANERLNTIYRSKLIQLDNAINEKAGLTVGAEAAKEIRQALRSMPEKERMKELNKALQRGDGEVIKAISGASELLTGIPVDTAQRTVEALQRDKAGDLIAQRDALDESFSASLTVIKDVNLAVKEGFDPKQLREIEEAAERHAQSVHAFEGAFGDPAE